MSFPPIERRPDLPKLERRVLKRWRDRNIFARTLEQTAAGSRFRFYEGPPTANGRPGVHHVEARVFKDLFPRYRTMLGQYVPRPAGWDCHGIPVELEVERELGISHKAEIEQYGVEEFNARCRESVTRYVGEFEKLTERIGYWVDTDQAYWTMSRPYVESVWWSIKALFDADMIYEDDRVVPYCPRCGTTLSDHEVAQGYEEAEDHSIYVRFPVTDGPLADEGADLLVWTTMPWTLIPATLGVVSHDLEYVLAVGGRAGDRPVVLASSVVERVLGDDARVVRRVALDELLGAHYRAPFELVGPGSLADPDGDPATWRYVVASDFVRADEGTGVVHTGAAYGEDDMKVARENDAPVVKPVDADGRFDGRCGPYAGMYVRDADQHIIDELERRELLVRADTYRHTFPFCWRCATPLLYYAKPSWYIATTRVRDNMLAENAGIDWHPEHIRDGRFGDWLANNVDWALSRERYWGTPLPVWRCERAHVTVIGSFDELEDRADLDLVELDLHRPAVDGITIPCATCNSTARRVPEVIDAWYDSGAMPFAQFGYPHRPGSEQRFLDSFPADLVCEAIDQTRGWFYSLLAISTLLFEQSSYQRALCLGLIVDDHGRKMSKTAGNTVDPWELIDRHGADALRWLLLAEGTPWQARRLGEDAVRDVTRRVLLTLWNTCHFLTTYADLDGWQPPPDTGNATATHPMDRWVLAELNDVVAEVRARMDAFDATRAARRIAQFIDDLSNWYVRLSRQRFSDRHSADRADRHQAFATLYGCLRGVVHLIAPFTPFIADHLHEQLFRPFSDDAPDSIHLSQFPGWDPALEDDALRRAMSTARRIVTLGRDARNTSGIPTRQPLQCAVLTVPSFEQRSIAELLAVISDELNVRSVEFATGDALPVQRSLRPNFAAIGPRYGPLAPEVATAIENADADRIVEQLRRTGTATIAMGSTQAELTPDDIDVVEEPSPGWSVSADGAYAVALDVSVGADLRLEGMAREVGRLINDLRRRRDLDLGDVVDVRVIVVGDPSGDIAEALDRHGDDIASEVNARTVSPDVPRDDRDGPGDRDPRPVGDGHIILEMSAVEREAAT